MLPCMCVCLCVCLCVYVWAISPALFFQWVFFFNVCSHWIALQTAGPRPCLPPAMTLLKKTKKTPAETLGLILDLLDLIGGFEHTL